MSLNGPGPGREIAIQREVARVALAATEGFALAGSGAIREHGIIDRPTEDVDLFTTSLNVTAFGVAVDLVISLEGVKARCALWAAAIRAGSRG